MRAAVLALAVLIWEPASPGAQATRGQAVPAGPAPAADALLDAGLDRANAEGKAVFVDFYASWCGPCRQLEAFLASPEAGPIVDEHFVVVRITVSERGDRQARNNPGGNTLMDRLGGGGGLPFYAILDADGTKRWSGTGMPWGRSGAEAFTAELAKASPGMTAEARSAMETALGATSGHRGALAGQVTEASGRPMAGATVTPLVPSYIDGFWQWRRTSPTTTDGDGRYVLDNVLPGTYRLVVEPGDDGWPATFFGDTARLVEAAQIVLAPGQSPTTLDVTVPGQAPLLTVAGTVVPTAPVAGAQVTLVSHDWPDRRIVTTAGPDGRFEFAKVPAGTYTAWAASTREQERAGVHREIGRAEVVAGREPAGAPIVIRTHAGATLSGRLEIDGDADPDTVMSIRVRAVPIDATPGAPRVTTEASVAADGSFTLGRLFGPVVLRVASVPPEWHLVSTSYRGFDVTDRPVAPSPNESMGEMSIVVSDRSAAVAGTVDVGAEPVTLGAVIVFSDDRQRWAFPSRFVRSTAVQPDGSFLVHGLPPGAYRVAHVETLDQSWQSPESLSALAEGAVLVSVAGGERLTVTVGRK